MPGPAVQTFLALAHGLAGAGDPSLRPLRDRHEVVEVLDDVEARTRTSVWNMQRDMRLSLYRMTADLDVRSRSRGLEELSIYPAPQAPSLPLLTSIDPGTRIGAVPFPLVVSDRRRAVLSAVLTGAPDEPFAWFTEDPDLATSAAEAFLECWEHAVPWQQAGLLPPLPERRRRVAERLAEGCTDAEIATELGISPRTVSAEVRAVVDWLGARNRTHAVAMLVGAA